jgi:hypothetical protein
MEKIPSKIAEAIYDTMVKFAEVSPKYFSRERFIYHFAVTPNMSSKLRLNTMDSRPRVFSSLNGTFRMSGKGETKVNPIISKLIEGYKVS